MQLKQAADQDQDAFSSKIEDFSKVIYENLDNIKQEEVAQALHQLYDAAFKSSKRSQSATINQIILILNDVFDAFQSPQMEDALKQQFNSTLEQLEKSLKINAA